MADEESWLYGEDNEEVHIKTEPSPPKMDETTSNPEEEIEDVKPVLNEKGEIVTGEDENDDKKETEGADADEEDDDEEDSDDDGFRITIDQNKIDEAKSSYNQPGVSTSGSGPTSFGMKTSNMNRHPEKKGRFTVEEFDQVVNVNGIPAHELDIESLDEKPWKKPGADITDYFNYGFTEETWQAYCNRQRKMRVAESGVGMPGMNNSISTNKNFTNSSVTTLHNNSIPTLGSSNKSTLGSRPPTIPNTQQPLQQPPQALQSSQSQPLQSAPAPSSIAVMTHDKREYSKKVISEIDFSVPPPGLSGIPTVGGAGPNVNLPPPPIHHHVSQQHVDFGHEDPFDFPSYSGGGYEPTMEAQWPAPPPPPPTWTDNSSSNAPPGDRDYSDKTDWNGSRSSSSRKTSRDDRRDYDRKRRRSRSRSRDRYRERDRDRRDRRRSRSKSPGYKHKKSKKDKKERIKEEIKKEPEDYHD